MQQPLIKTIPNLFMIGLKKNTCLADSEAFALWQTFKPQVKTISNRADDDFYSIQVYDSNFGKVPFTPQTRFDKWAAVQVSDHRFIPEDLEPFTLKGGLYAVFIHKGTPQMFPKTAQYIYGQWIPNSEYDLDDRPHFEVLGSKYKLNNPSSEEEVWIPIKPK